MRRGTVLKIGSLLIIIVVIIVINIAIIEKRKALYGDYVSTSEYLITEDLVNLFDMQGEGIYKFTFDMRADQVGPVNVYLYDSDNTKYWITPEIVNVTDTFTTYGFEKRVTLVEEGSPHAHLVFHGTYGTGVIPTVKELTVEKVRELDYVSTSEYLVTEDLVDLFDLEGEGIYRFSFSVKAEMSGPVNVSLYDSDDTKYWITPETIDVTDTFKRYEFEKKVSMVENDSNHAHLTFHGTFGTGVIPTVADLKVEKVGEIDKNEQ